MRGIRFIDLQKKYIDKGYSKEKAFNLANEEFVTQHTEMNLDSKILNDYAQRHGATSFHSYAQREAVIIKINLGI